ncbi:hypothetical protein OAU53_02685 [Candidatus Pelagibacter sp.]|nr:hypothetical protein [Candidatus Pelagibacter sp.]
MILSKTPYRISFFGGGSDYPEWLSENNGEVISTTINKYIYISCRELPPFFKHRHRILYSKTENVKNIQDIKHKAMRALLEKIKPKIGLEIHYDGDLPSKSGMGSSSSFIVGCLKAFYEQFGINHDKKKLVNESIILEQKVLKETVGSQDQVAAAYGGFNNIIFSKNKIKVKPISLSKKEIKKFSKNFFLIYTNQMRTASNIAKEYIEDLSIKNKRQIQKIIDHTSMAKKFIKQKAFNDFGNLLNETWHEKKQINNIISNSKIDYLYNKGIRNGALGGKLLGAGAGGFLLFYVPIKNREKFKLSFSNELIIPLEFTTEGSEIIFNDKKR